MIPYYDRHIYNKERFKFADYLFFRIAIVKQAKQI
jgi:hypothetical protein